MNCVDLNAGRALVVGAVAAGGADDEHGLALAAARSHGGNEDDGGLDFHFECEGRCIICDVEVVFV